MLGNEHAKPISFTFEVRQMSGEIVSVQTPQETVTTAEAFPLIVSTDNTDDIMAVGIACYVQDEQVCYYQLERSGDSWQTNVFPVAGVEKMNLVATAYDGFGNTQSYEPIPVLMNVPAQEQGISLTLPMPKGRGFSDHRSSLRRTRGLTGSHTSVRFGCAPPYRETAVYANRRRPSIKMFLAALTSLSWTAPQEGHTHVRMERSFTSVF